MGRRHLSVDAPHTSGAFKLELSVEGYLDLVRPSLWVEGASDESLATPVF